MASIGTQRKCKILEEDPRAGRLPSSQARPQDHKWSQQQKPKHPNMVLASSFAASSFMAALSEPKADQAEKPNLTPAVLT